MEMAQLATFDTYKLVKRLENKGASTELAKEIIDAIQQGRVIELSALVSKTDFYNFRDEFHDFKEHNEKRLSKIENKLVVLDNKIETTKKELRKDIAILNNKIEVTKQELKKEIELATSQLETRTEQVKNAVIMWLVGLFIPLYAGVAFLIVKLFL